MADDGSGSGNDESLFSPVQKWFSPDNGPLNWRFDVVTLLAVIGESSVAEHSQAITASVFCLLPRLIPAPQALLKGQRPSRMPEVTAKVTGVYSGVVLDTVGFFANIIHPLDQCQPLGFKMIEISHVDRNTAGGMEVSHKSAAADASRFSHIFRRTNTALSTRSARIPGPPPDDGEGTDLEMQARATGVAFSADTENGRAGPPQQGITRRTTMKQRATDYVSNPTLGPMKKRPAVPAMLWSPIHILTLFSVLLTVGIIIAARYWEDGTAIVAVSVISLTSSVVGIASRWSPILMNRSHTNRVPDGDVVIRTREGAFLLIKCTEEVARELYSGTEECQYQVGARMYSALMGVGTWLLMLSVILLGNCSFNSQCFIGGSYILLNGLYWFMSLLPKRYFWDLSRYKCKDITPKDSPNAHETSNKDDAEGVKSFTRTLWWVIRETKRTAWVERSGAAPSTPQWRAWLAEAEQAAKDGNRQWPAVLRKSEFMNMSDDDILRLNSQKSPVERHERDPAEQAAPAVEVQPRNDQPAPTSSL